MRYYRSSRAAAAAGGEIAPQRALRPVVRLVTSLVADHEVAGQIEYLFYGLARRMMKRRAAATLIFLEQVPEDSHAQYVAFHCGRRRLPKVAVA